MMPSDHESHESDLASLVVSDTDSDDFRLSVHETKFIRALYEESSLNTEIPQSIVDLSDLSDCVGGWVDLSVSLGKMVDLRQFVVKVSDFCSDLNAFVSDLSDFVAGMPDLKGSADDDVSEADGNPNPDLEPLSVDSVDLPSCDPKLLSSFFYFSIEYAAIFTVYK